MWKKLLGCVIAGMTLLSVLCVLPIGAAEGISLIATIPISTGEKEDQTTSAVRRGDYLYVYTNQGIDVISVRDMAAPALLSQMPEALRFSGETYDNRLMDAAGDYLYFGYRDIADEAKPFVYKKMDIRNPEMPGETARVTGLPSRGWAMKVVGNYCYIGFDNGLAQFDAQLDKLAWKADIDMGSGRVNRIAHHNGYLYVLFDEYLKAYKTGADGSISAEECTVADLTEHKIAGGEINDLHVDDNYVYIACHGNGKNKVVYLSNKRPDAMDVAEQYVYTSPDPDFKPDGIASHGKCMIIGSYGKRRTEIVNVANPGKPELYQIIGEQSTGVLLPGSCITMLVEGNVLIISGKWDGTAFVQLPAGEIEKGDVGTQVPEPGQEQQPGQPTAPTKTFADIEGHWAQQDVEYAAERGIVAGVDETNFAPDATITRAEFLTILTRAVKLNPVTYAGFAADVSGTDWYANTLQAAQDAGLLDPAMLAGGAQPQTPITREEMTSAIVNAYEWVTDAAPPAGSVDQFSDRDQISPWAAGYVAAASGLGIVQGKTADAFEPGSTATRAEATVMTKRVMDALGETLDALTWKQPPVLYRASDAAKPGDSVTLYGGFLTPSACEIKLAPAQADTVTSEPPADARAAEVVQTDAEGHFAVTVLPADLPAGAYDVWVKNEYGWSKPVVINAPRPQWIDTNEAAAGLSVKLTGRNLLGSEFGAADASRVRLVGEAGTFEMTLTAANPYALDFTVPDGTPLGIYDVQASNDGVLWRGLEYPQQLEIVEKGEDPLGLGVSWAREFQWNNQVNVKDHGAAGDGATDDTQAVQAAVDAAHAAGGGVVYFPGGDYHLKSVALPARVVLLGESKESTRLTLADVDASVPSRSFITTKDDAKTVGRNGIANLTVGIDEANPDQLWPDTFIHLGQDWNDAISSMADRTGEKCFISNIHLTYPYEMREGSGRGMAVQTTLYQHYLLKDSTFTGYGAYTPSNYVSYYTRWLNNDFTCVTSNCGISCTYTVAMHNTISYHEPWQEGMTVLRRGLDMDGPAYLEGNRFSDNTTDDNAGEVINYEANQGGTKMFGTIQAAAGSTAILDPMLSPEGVIMGHSEEGQNSWDFLKRRWGWWNIVIVDGKGMGQYRQVVGVNGNTVTLDRPWDIVPDSTSKFTAVIPERACTMYQNSVTRAGKGYWLYLNGMDCVIADNDSVDAEGVFLQTYYVRQSETNSRMVVGYFNRMENNRVSGVSQKSHVAGIGAQAGIEYNEAFGYHVYGLSIRGNSITGVLPAPEIGDFSEAPKVNGIYIVTPSSYEKPDRYVIKGCTIEGNTLKDLDRGITLGSDSNPLQPYKAKGSLVTGVLVKDNTYENVEKKMTDDGTDNVVYIGETEE